MHSLPIGSGSPLRSPRVVSPVLVLSQTEAPRSWRSLVLTLFGLISFRVVFAILRASVGDPQLNGTIDTTKELARPSSRPEPAGETTPGGRRTGVFWSSKKSTPLTKNDLHVHWWIGVISQSRASVCKVRNVPSVGIKGDVINRGQLQTRDRTAHNRAARGRDRGAERILMLLLFSNYIIAILETMRDAKQSAAGDASSMNNVPAQAVFS